jgi:hypothetical protein
MLQLSNGSVGRVLAAAASLEVGAALPLLKQRAAEVAEVGGAGPAVHVIVVQHLFHTGPLFSFISQTFSSIELTEDSKEDRAASAPWHSLPCSAGTPGAGTIVCLGLTGLDIGKIDVCSFFLFE